MGELAIHPPKNQEELGRVRGLSSGWRNNDIGGRLMSALASARPLEPDEMPDREPRRPGLTKEGALVSDLLKLLLKIRAKEAGVASKLIARSDELEALGRRRPQGSEDSVRMALRGVRARRRQPGRGAHRLCDRERQIEVEPRASRRRSMRRLMLLILIPLTACAPGQSGANYDRPGRRAYVTHRALGSFVGQAPTKENAIKLHGLRAARNPALGAPTAAR